MEALKAFLEFMKTYGHKDMINKSDGSLSTKGCNGHYGGCCSGQFDLRYLSVELRTLKDQLARVGVNLG